MCTFDAPIARCEAMHVMVITDLTQAQCACEHECPNGVVCPLDGFFTGVVIGDAIAPVASLSASPGH